MNRAQQSPWSAPHKLSVVWKLTWALRSSALSVVGVVSVCVVRAQGWKSVVRFFSFRCICNWSHYLAAQRVVVGQPKALQQPKALPVRYGIVVMQQNNHIAIITNHHYLLQHPLLSLLFYRTGKSPTVIDNKLLVRRWAARWCLVGSSPQLMLVGRFASSTRLIYEQPTRTPSHTHSAERQPHQTLL